MHDAIANVYSTIDTYKILRVLAGQKHLKIFNYLNF